MEIKSKDRLMELFLDFGEAMMSAGAEIGRVESSLNYLCHAYGSKKANVFVITASIVVTVLFSDGEEVTASRRILSTGGTNYERLRRLNSLCRKCCLSPLSAEELEKELVAIQSSRPSFLKLYGGSALASGAFSIFFGGGPIEAALAALFGLFVCFLQTYLSPRCPNTVFFLFVSSLLTGIGIHGLHALSPFFQADIVVIGDIMLLVPGIAVTAAVGDILIGDTISGSTKLLESLIRAAALAAGFMISLMIFGR